MFNLMMVTVVGGLFFAQQASNPVTVTDLPLPGTSVQHPTAKPSPGNVEIRQPPAAKPQRPAPPQAPKRALEPKAPETKTEKATETKTETAAPPKPSTPAVGEAAPPAAKSGGGKRVAAFWMIVPGK